MSPGGASVPELSVIIPTRNRAKYLVEAIESVLRVRAELGDRVAIEVLVVDDGSTDETQDAVARYPVRALSSPRRGVSAARNTGIEAARGEFVAFLDDDDVWLPGHVQAHMQVLRKSPHVALVYAQGVLADVHLNPAFPPAPAAPLPSGDVFVPFLRQCIQWNTVIARKRVLDAVGGFDERLEFSQDWDLQLRVAARYDCVGLPFPVTLFRQDHGAFRGYQSWRRNFLQTLGIVERGARLQARSAVPLRKRFGLTFEIRGWYAYHFFHSAQIALETDRSREAVLCLLGAMHASPLHVAFRIPGYWPTVGRALTRKVRGQRRSRPDQART